MPTSNYGHALNESDVAAYAENWQRCLTEDLPPLFYAFDAGEGMTERISSFRISGTTVDELLTATESFGSDYRFYVRLALKPGYRDQDVITDTPFFYPLIQVASTNLRGLNDKNAFIPDWNPDPKIGQGTDNDVDEIPGAGAYLFVENWLAEAHEDLADVFTLSASHSNQRVLCYKFSKDESKAIYDALNAVKSDNPQLSVHLGSSFVVSSHPVAFRPVLEVSSGSGRGRLLSNKSNAYFDFSTPSPPYPAGG